MSRLTLETYLCLEAKVSYEKGGTRWVLLSVSDSLHLLGDGRATFLSSSSIIFGRFVEDGGDVRGDRGLTLVCGATRVIGRALDEKLSAV